MKYQEFLLLQKECSRNNRSVKLFHVYISIYIYNKNRRFSCVQANFGAKFIGSAEQLFRPYWVSSAAHTYIYISY